MPKKNPVVDIVEVYQDSHDEFRWTAKAGNGKKVADSGEGYHNLSHTKKMAKELYPDARIKYVPSGN